MTTPYTYLIGWPHLDRWYYGVRYANRCTPDDLWNPYTTSSKHVKEFIKNNGAPTVIEVRRTFKDTTAARLWENKVLTRLNVISRPKWLNKTTNKSIAPQQGVDHPNYGKTGRMSPIFGIKRSEKFRAQKRESWQGLNNPSKNRELLEKSISKRSGQHHHMKKPEVVEKISGKNNYLYRNPELLKERREQFIRMNKMRAGTQYLKDRCPFCDAEIGKNNIKRHIQCCEKKTI